MLAFVLFSANAFALSSPSQIAAMMDSGNLRGAETALTDVLKVKDTAKVHYMLAQVYLKEGRAPDARSELARANQMDPEHSYTDNAHYRPIADAIAGHVVHTNSAPTRSVAVGAVAAVPAGPPADFTVLWVVLFLIVIGAIAYFVYTSYSERKEKRDALNAARDELTTKAAELVQDVEEAILNEKTSVMPDANKLAAINTLKTKVLDAYARSKSLHTDVRSEVTEMISEFNNLRYKLNSVLITDYSTRETSVKMKSGWPKSGPMKKITEPAYTPRQSPAQAAQPAPVAQPAPTYTQAPTVVVQNDNTMSTILAAEMLMESSRRDERDRQERRDREERAERERDREEAREAARERAAAQAERDSGNNDSWSSSSSDSGNNDSF